MDAMPDSSAHAAERLTFTHFVHELQHQWHLEKGLPHTIVDLLRRPGDMLRGYFAGTRRAGYTNPITYSLLAAGASLLAYGLYREPYVAWMRMTLAARPAGAQAAAFMRAYSEHLFEVTEHTAINAIALAIPQAILVWLLFRGPRFNLAESFALALYSIGTYMFLYVALVTPVLYFAHAWTIGQWAGVLLEVGVALHIGLGLFGMGARQAGKLLFAVLASFGIWTGALAIGVATYTLVRG